MLHGVDANDCLYGVAGEGMDSAWGAGGRALDLLEEPWEGVERHTHL